LWSGEVVVSRGATGGFEKEGWGWGEREEGLGGGVESGRRAAEEEPTTRWGGLSPLIRARPRKHVSTTPFLSKIYTQKRRVPLRRKDKEKPADQQLPPAPAATTADDRRPQNLRTSVRQHRVAVF
jgi:hypothetical protein